MKGHPGGSLLVSAGPVGSLHGSADPVDGPSGPQWAPRGVWNHAVYAVIVVIPMFCGTFSHIIKTSMLLLLLCRVL